MSYFDFSDSLYEFLLEAQEVFIRQPDRQYLVEKRGDDYIQFLLLKDDPCETRARPDGRTRLIIYDGATLAGYISMDVLMRLQPLKKTEKQSERK